MQIEPISLEAMERLGRVNTLRIERIIDRIKAGYVDVESAITELQKEFILAGTHPENESAWKDIGIKGGPEQLTQMRRKGAFRGAWPRVKPA